MQFSKAKFPHCSPGFYLQPLAQFALANISQRQFLFLGDAEQIRNRQMIFWRALRRSSEIESGEWGGDPTPGFIWTHRAPSADGLLCLCTPDSRKRTPQASGRPGRVQRDGGCVPAPELRCPPSEPPGEAGSRGGGVWGPRGLNLETHVPSKSLYFL